MKKLSIVSAAILGAAILALTTSTATAAAVDRANNHDAQRAHDTGNTQSNEITITHEDVDKEKK